MRRSMHLLLAHLDDKDARRHLVASVLASALGSELDTFLVISRAIADHELAVREHNWLAIDASIRLEALRNTEGVIDTTSIDCLRRIKQSDRGSVELARVLCAGQFVELEEQVCFDPKWLTETVKGIVTKFCL